MYIAQKLKKQSVALYLMYMWQVEDLIRANDFDMDKIKANIINAYGLNEEQSKVMTEWYEQLIEMMRRENVMQQGHIQLNKNIIVWLTDLHLRLLHSTKFPYYSAAYYKALPFIVELRAKGADRELPELETCFEAMYGVYLLRLQKKEVSAETEKAVKAIEDLLALLSDYYNKDKEGTLELE